jgi:tRNA A-37 threonylcarbamoyl transferase component Bud32
MSQFVARIKFLGSFSELKTYTVMAESGLHPKIVAVKLQNNKIAIAMENYGETLQQYIDNGGDPELYRGIIVNKIKKFHDLGYVHGDLHASNILINTAGIHDVLFIDFETSIRIEDASPSIIKIYNAFLEPGKSFETIQDVLDYEVNLQMIHEFHN